MNTYTWLIDSLECIPSANGKSNVVCNVHWRLNATDDKNTAGTYGVQHLMHKPTSPFTNYDNLTKDTVIGWVQDAMGTDAVTALQESLDKQLENLANPPIISPKLPWAE